MSVTVDAEKRVVLPDATPGEKFDVETPGNGIFILRRLESVNDQDQPANCKLVKKNGFTVLMTDRKVSEQTLKAALADFPP